MSFSTYSDVNNDNVIRAWEESQTQVNLKEDGNMTNINVILKDAVAVWTSFVGDKKTRFERLVDGKWFDWATHVIYDDKWFRDTLSTMTNGEDYIVEYA